MSNFTFAKDYLLHRLKANNRHGVHSPFVYTLIDKVIYDYRDKDAYHKINEAQNRGGAKPKVRRLLYRLVAHFGPSSIIVLGSISKTTELCLQSAAPAAQFFTGEIPTSKADLIYINAEASKDNALKFFDKSLPATHQNTVLILAGNYKNAGMKQDWADIKNHPQVTLTIDLFWMGLVFFRSGRAEKEHFKVKY